MKLRTSLFVLFALVMVIAAEAATDHSSGVPAVQALKQLKDGAERFATGQSTYPHQDADRMKEIVGGQKPFATVLSCSDSRVPVEMIFDAGFGDLFVVRVAGNVAGTEQIGTIEYGVEHLGSNVLVVLGHTKCGAVTAAATDAKAEGAIASLIQEIIPAVAEAKAKKPTLAGADLVPMAITENVWCTIRNLLQKSPLLRERVQNGTLRITGAIYHLEDNTVEWLGRHPAEKELLAQAPASQEAADLAPAIAAENAKDSEVAPATKAEEPAVVAAASSTPTPAAGALQEQLLALQKQVAQLQAQTQKQANDSSLTALAAELAVLRAQVNTLSGRSTRKGPKLASTDEEFAVADNASLEKLSAQVTTIQTDLDKVKKVPATNAPSVKQGAINLTGMVHQQFYDKFGKTKVSSFESKRVRLGFNGTINSWASIEFMGEFAKAPKLLDGALSLAPAKGWLIRFGQYRPPSGTELSRSTMALPFVNYSLAMALNTDRDIGASLGYQKALSKMVNVNLMAGLYNGAGINASDSNTAKNTALRAEVKIANHVMIAPNAYFGKTNSVAAAKNIDTYGATANWTAKSRIIESEFTYSKVGGQKKSGWYVWGGQSLNTGFKFCPEIQFVSRYERFDDNLEKADNATNRVTIGTNFFVDKKFTMIQMNYQINGEQGTSISNNELLLNVQVAF